MPSSGHCTGSGSVKWATAQDLARWRGPLRRFWFCTIGNSRNQFGIRYISGVVETQGVETFVWSQSWSRSKVLAPAPSSGSSSWLWLWLLVRHKKHSLIFIYHSRAWIKYSLLSWIKKFTIASCRSQFLELYATGARAETKVCFPTTLILVMCPDAHDWVATCTLPCIRLSCIIIYVTVVSHPHAEFGYGLCHSIEFVKLFGPQGGILLHAMGHSTEFFYALSHNL
jgi:hypothetical protein